MKQFAEPTIEIIQLEITDILTASNDRLTWDLYGDNSGWVTD